MIQLAKDYYSGVQFPGGAAMHKIANTLRLKGYTRPAIIDAILYGIAGKSAVREFKSYISRMMPAARYYMDYAETDAAIRAGLREYIVTLI